MSIALARRYRPKRFADLLVQDHVAAVLRGAVARDRVGHGYLLTGPGASARRPRPGSSPWRSTARIASRRASPAASATNCLRIWNGSANLDVVEIDAASNRGVDDARDLRERAMYAASQEGHHKVYIVDEAHMLTREAWNALLKILEEPPPRRGVRVRHDRAAEDRAPRRPRCCPGSSDSISAGSAPRAIRDRLRAGADGRGASQADDDALTLIARHADGGMRDALSVLDQCLSFGEGAVTAARVREILGLAGRRALRRGAPAGGGARPAGACFPWSTG